MATASATDQMVNILRDTVVALVRRDGPDLSARQLGVFLTCYLQDGAHTVRGLAADLNVSKPAITRALDRLGELDLARRKVDPMDRRSVLVQRTLKGQAFLRDLRGIMTEAGAASKKTTTPVVVDAPRRAPRPRLSTPRLTSRQTRRGDHPPFTPPAVNPATISFCINNVSSSTGSVTSNAAAASGPQLTCSKVSTL